MDDVTVEKSTNGSPQPADEDDKKDYPFDGPEPWWWSSFSPVALEGCGCGCLFVPFLFLVTSRKDGSFRIELADLFCFVTLISILSAFRTFWGADLLWIDQVWMAVLIGLGCGVLLALLRQRLAWMFAGLTVVPLMWFFVEMAKQYGKFLSP